MYIYVCDIFEFSSDNHKLPLQEMEVIASVQSVLHQKVNESFDQIWLVIYFATCLHCTIITSTAVYMYGYSGYVLWYSQLHLHVHVCTITCTCPHNKHK